MRSYTVHYELLTGGLLDPYIVDVANFTRKFDFSGKIYQCEPEITLSEVPYFIDVGQGFFAYVGEGLNDPDLKIIASLVVTEITRNNDNLPVLKCQDIPTAAINENFINDTEYKGYGPREYAYNILRGCITGADWSQAVAQPSYTDSQGWQNCRLSNQVTTLGGLSTKSILNNAGKVGTIVRAYYTSPQYVADNAAYVFTTDADAFVQFDFSTGSESNEGATIGSGFPLHLHRKGYASGNTVNLPWLRCYLTLAKDSGLSGDIYYCVGSVRFVMLDMQCFYQNTSGTTNLQQLVPIYKREGQETEKTWVVYEPNKLGFLRRKTITDKVTDPEETKTAWSQYAADTFSGVSYPALSSLKVQSDLKFKQGVVGDKYGQFDPDNAMSQWSNYCFVSEPTIFPPDISAGLKAYCDANDENPVVNSFKLMQDVGLKTINQRPFDFAQQAGELAFLSQSQLITRWGFSGSTLYGFVDLCPLYSSKLYPVTLSAEYCQSVTLEGANPIPAIFNFNFVSPFGTEYKRAYMPGVGTGKDTIEINLCQGVLARQMAQSAVNSWVIGSNQWEGCPGLLGDRLSASASSSYPFNLLTVDGQLLHINGFAAKNTLTGYTVNNSGAPSISATEASYEPFLADNSKIILDSTPNGNEPALDISPVTQAINLVLTCYGQNIDRKAYRVELADTIFLPLQLGELIEINLPLETETPVKTAALVTEITINKDNYSIVVVPFNSARASSYTKRSAI